MSSIGPARGELAQDEPAQNALAQDEPADSEPAQDEQPQLGQLQRHWDLVVVGARLSGALTAHALAPQARSVLLVDRSGPQSFWPQQVTWDRQGVLAWQDLGLLDTVLACGAPKLRGHVRRTLDAEVEYPYPADDEHCYRMSVPREVLDPALAARAAEHPATTLVRPATATALLEQGRVTGVRVSHQGRSQDVTADLVVFADGRLSRNVARIGAGTYAELTSPWTALLGYFADLPLPADRVFYARQPGSMLIVTPCGPALWCVAVAMHARLLAAHGVQPKQLYARVVEADPRIGPAVAAGRQVTPIGGAGGLRMLRRPMTGPGWVLVGDSGYHLDPMSALGTHAVLTTVRLLRDRVRALGRISPHPADYDGLTRRRDDELSGAWTLTEQIISSYAPRPQSLRQARLLATDPAAVQNLLRTQMGLPVQPSVPLAGVS